MEIDYYFPIFAEKEMPYKAEKILIEGTKYDKRIKLTPEVKFEIKKLYESGDYSQRDLAKMFNVSRRSIQFIIYPEKLEKNIQDRLDRGGSKQYYDREKHREYIKTHRKYKHNLFKQGKINSDDAQP